MVGLIPGSPHQPSSQKHHPTGQPLSSILIPGTYQQSINIPGTWYIILRGTIVNRTYGTHKNLYIYPFLLTIFGPINYGPRNSIMRHAHMYIHTHVHPPDQLESFTILLTFWRTTTETTSSAAVFLQLTTAVHDRYIFR